MARRTIGITIEDRGNPLHFTIEEMSATKLESWIIRAILAVSGAGIEVPSGTDLAKASEFLVSRGISALATIDYEKAKPLLDELLGCCYRKLDKVKERCTPDSVDGYIEDVTTLFKLKMEAAKLNLGFIKLEVDKLSTSQDEASITPQQKAKDTPITRTSLG